MSGPILTVVDDLIFLSKIQQTARAIGVPIEIIDASQVERRLAENPGSRVILDLNHHSGKAVEVLRGIKGNSATCQVPVVAFLSHVQTDLAAAARAAGCNQVLARSAFVQQLPELLLELAS